MKRFTMQALAVVGVLGFCEAASAQDHGRVCSESTLRGKYIFAASGFFVAPGGVLQPKAILEVIDFNGDGTLTVPAVTVSMNGSVSRFPPGVGDYTLDAECKGTILFANNISFDIFIGQDAKTIWMIQTNQGNVFQGTATRLGP
jgi:hypothetical protein